MNATPDCILTYPVVGPHRPARMGYRRVWFPMPKDAVASFRMGVAMGGVELEESFPPRFERGAAYDDRRLGVAVDVPCEASAVLTGCCAWVRELSSVGGRQVPLALPPPSLWRAEPSGTCPRCGLSTLGGDCAYCATSKVRCPQDVSPAKSVMNVSVRDDDGTRRYLVNEVRRLCDRVLWCQASRKSGDLDADLDSLEEQRCIVERVLAALEGV